MGRFGSEITTEIDQDKKIALDSRLEPIPIEKVDGWKGIPVLECGEDLVSVGPFSEFSDCDTSAVYFGERGQGTDVNFLGEPVDRDVSLITHFVRKGILQKMKIAQSMLPEGYYFKFLDNFRPLEVQQALFDAQKSKFHADHPEWDDEKLDSETQTYVSLPSPNIERGTTHPSPHSTGGVVDLTIIRLLDEGQKAMKDLEARRASGQLRYPISEDEQQEDNEVASWINEEAKRKGWDEGKKQIVLDNWLAEYRYAKNKGDIFRTKTQELNMGTDFDHFGPEAGMRYFEKLEEQGELSPNQQEILRNRRYLYKIMKSAGFSNYPEEWWHWSSGDNMDAANTGKDHAIYGTAQMSDDNKSTEWSRKGVYQDASERVGKKELFSNSIEDDPSVE